MNIAAQVKWVFLAVALLSSIGYCSERDRRLKAEGRAEVEAARVDSLSVLAEQARIGTVRATLRADSVRAVSDSVVARMRDQISDLRDRRPPPDTVVRTVLAADCDSVAVAAAIGSMVASYEAELSALQQITAQQATVIAAGDSLIAQLTAQTHADAAFIGALRAQVAAIQGTRPSWTERNLGRVALVTGGALLGAVVWETVR